MTPQVTVTAWMVSATIADAPQIDGMRPDHISVSAVRTMTGGTRTTVNISTDDRAIHYADPPLPNFETEMPEWLRDIVAGLGSMPMGGQL